MADLISSAFFGFEQSTCFHFDFSLAPFDIYFLRCDWLLVWFWFNSSHLKMLSIYGQQSVLPLRGSGFPIVL